MPTPKDRYYFASDNSASISPEAWEAIAKVNTDAVGSYGNDAVTKLAKQKIRDFFETDCEVFFVFTGTAANALLSSAMCQRYETMHCHEYAHIETDECSAPEFFGAGSRIRGLGGANGKIDLKLLKQRLDFPKEVHHSPVSAVSISLPTELGTVYSMDELRALGELCKTYDIYYHIDGARMTNAIVSLNKTPAEITWKAGVDAVSFGGTKQGLGLSEAVVIFNKELAEGFAYRQKQAGQLASKMRFLTAPWTVFLNDGVWNRYAQNGNAMMKEVVKVMGEFGMKPLWDVQANASFFQLPEKVRTGLEARGWHVYSFHEGTNRFMTSWSSRIEHVQELKADLSSL